MPLHIEGQALIGNCETAALAGRMGRSTGSAFPRSIREPVFAALPGSPDNGRWLIAPEREVRSIRRRHRAGTLVFEAEFEANDAGRRYWPEPV
jgi:hypothetical protein